jgi:putative effector of murein hydrolase
VARAPVTGMYRFWRDTDYVAGGLIAGATADALGVSGAIAGIAGLTAASGLSVALDRPPTASGASAGRRRRARRRGRPD